MRSTARTRLTLETLVPRDVLSALQAIGIDAEERGDEAVALCPHPDHDDSHPSWSVNLESGQHHCFACGFGGSFVYLVTKMLGIPTPDSQQWVRERKIKDLAAGIEPRVKKVRQAATLSEADLWKFTDPPAEALASRGLTLEACQQYGVMWDDERQLWISPVRDPFSDRLWGWQEKNARYFRNRPMDIPKADAVFGYRELVPGGAALLVESPLDVPYLHELLDPGVHPVSSYGAAVSDQQVSLIRERASMVILAMDNDKPGWKAVSKLAFAFGTTPVVVFNYASTTSDHRDYVAEPDGRDPGNLTKDEVTWGVKHAIDAWRLRIPWL